MKKLITLFGVMIITVILVLSCKKDNEAMNEEEVYSEDTLRVTEAFISESLNDSVVKSNSLLKFKIMPIESDINGNPASKIYVSTDLALDFVASITGKATIIKNNEFSKMNIPNEAVSACGSSWKGLDTYFYIIDAKSGYKIFKGTLDTSDPNKTYKWEEFQLIN
ncbi:hypothetical protein [Flavobacterium sp.]|jgi:hypothetical protein|uniref:hypothetical protein n=1 Tax=Flavobacterium sp. TaxID=239 RepID=UPI002A7FF1A5|nr:hypothetical protein [Flavobacterium sp.]